MKSKQNLVIVESPAKSKTIEKFLGSNYKVVASMGHIRDLPSGYMGINVKNNFEPQYEINKQRKKLIDELIIEAKRSDYIYLAPDPDREGEAIAWHLSEVLKDHNPNFRRVQFNEITKTAVVNAFQNDGKINLNRVNSQQTRRMIDRLVGYLISPLLQAKKPGATSAGRVQTVALRLIVQREKNIRAFVPQEYWSLKANVLNGDGEFEVQLAKVNGGKVNIVNEKEMEVILDVLKGKNLIFKEMKITPKKRNPYPPFITSTLQQDSSLNMSPAQIMRIAQQLYEGVRTAEGTVGLITYMRTDSVAVSNNAKEMARDFIENNYGREYLASVGKVFKSKETAQEAHEAIRPTAVMRTPKEMENYLDFQQLKLYSLIWRRFIASQMSPAKFEQRALELINENYVEGQYLFRATISKLIFAGFLKVYKEEEQGEQESLPNLIEGTAYPLKKMLPKQHFTEPPLRFSEATLVGELEANNIGRPSTYASTVKTIQDRGYVEKEKGKLLPNTMGEEVCDYLVENFSALFAIEFTGEMEDKLDLIESGNDNWKDILQSFYANLQEWITTVKAQTAVPKEKVYLVLNSLLLAKKIEWQEPRKIGSRIYDEKAFVKSLQVQAEGDGLFSEKQFYAVVKIFVRCLKFIDNASEVIEQSDIAEMVANIQAGFEGAEVDKDRIALLDSVEFTQPVKQGKRVYDDGKFYSSLKNQVENGKKLSEKQVNALVALIEKYKTQIDDCDNMMKRVSLEKSVKDEERCTLLNKFFALFDYVDTWDEPVTKGKRVYDDANFIKSLRSQLMANSDLSDRQIVAAKRTLKKYSKFVPEYESIIEKFFKL